MTQVYSSTNTRTRRKRPGDLLGSRTLCSVTESVERAFSRAQNLLIIIGNRWAYEDARVDIEDEDGFKQRKRYFANLHRKIGKGGMLDGRDLL